MVTTKNISNAALIKYRLGIVLLWLGILTWLPFIALRIAGETPSLFWFLPFHLAGVIGGSRLRKVARKDMNLPPPQKSHLQMLGHGLILAGILVWVPYFYMKLAHQPVEVMDYLPFHLVGVLGGASILGINFFVSQRAAE